MSRIRALTAARDSGQLHAVLNIRSRSALEKKLRAQLK